jgi:hypothetical protein
MEKYSEESCREALENSNFRKLHHFFLMVTNQLVLLFSFIFSCLFDNTFSVASSGCRAILLNNVKHFISSYSLMSAGLHGDNGLDHVTSISIMKTYILPILTYSLEVLQPRIVQPILDRDSVLSISSRYNL